MVGDRRSGPPEEVVGTNELIGTDPAKLAPAFARLMAGQWKKGAIPQMWDGRAAVRIVAELERLLAAAPHPSPLPAGGERG